MYSEKIKTYDECNIDEKEVIDSFRKMKLLYDHSRFKFHRLQIEDLIKDYEKLMSLREEIQSKYFSIYDELVNEDLIEGQLYAISRGIDCEHEVETWNAELSLLTEIKVNFDMAIAMIEKSETEQAIINDENNL